MSGRKYENLIKKLVIRKGPGGVLPDQLVWMESKDLEGINLCFGGGVHGREAGVGHTWAGAHTHKYDEILFFHGLNPSDITYLGTEMAIEIGEEQEEHIFNESSIVVVPREMPHGPISNMQKRLHLHYHIVLGPETQTTWKSKEAKPPKTHGTKYSHLFKPLRPKILKKSENESGPGSADQIVWFSSQDLEGLAVNFTWSVHSKCGVWHRYNSASKAHMHPFDEALFFLGFEPSDINYLGAEVEIYIGKEQEKYVFDRAAAVVLPKNIPHGPIVTTWVDKPFGCFKISLDKGYKVTWV
ncbi:MAG: hypothetical protein RMJ15_05145 [Nitrososphaerota archaeon]|nr:hypothetical protein [Candidatus Bathyarchaeota archaeon]MDW8023104.1 hypothetical protein [Nitrososphaerota archaeon]